MEEEGVMDVCSGMVVGGCMEVDPSGIGGGCIDDVVCGAISEVGDSRTVAGRNFGVRGSEEGGET